MKNNNDALVPGSKAGREMFGSRLGFLLLSAGCAIGLGNVWRFPFITGEYGGAVFVFFYIISLLAILPVMIMEFAVGRASRLNMGLALRKLEPPGTHWQNFGWFALAGSYLLMMFYTTVTGWMLSYCYYMAAGHLGGLNAAQVGEFFGSLLAKPGNQILAMTIVTVAGFAVCSLGIKKGVERVVKYLMLGLLFILVLLVIRALLLPGAGAGVSFYLWPDFARAAKAGIFDIWSAAMTQAFFTLSIGIGCMCIIGSYQPRDRSLTGEAVWIAGLDTFVGLMAGLIIFPACFSFDISPSAGPGLIFVTLPNIFNSMAAGQFWGSLFFVFLACASLSTVIAVFENIISYSVDVWGYSRRKSVIVHTVFMWLFSLPCALGGSLLAGFQPLGSGSTVLDLEDFILSNNLLPAGGILFILFCTARKGWGWDSFLQEVNEGKGLRFPARLRFFLTWILPIIIFCLFIVGYVQRFFR